MRDLDDFVVLIRYPVLNTLTAKMTQHAQSIVYRFVPVQDFTEPWTDEKLYKKYGIMKDE